MAIFDIDYSKAGPLLLPPDKRGGYMLSWAGVVLKPMQWIVDLWLHDYRVGSLAADWIVGSTYAKYDRVKYQFAIYESLGSGNIGNVPTNATYWMLVQPNFIGISERVLYNGITLTLTYALNKRFGTIFRQPNNVSDIYINNNTPPISPFIFGNTEGNSSSFFSQLSTEFFINSYSFTGSYNFTINVPVAAYTSLDPLPANQDKIFRSFVDSIIPAGVTYNIQTY